MSFWTLLEVATMPVVQVILITILGALMACDFWNVLHADARKYMNKVVFMVLTPSLMFASLAKTVTLNEIISWWFIPINTGLTFLFGGILGWMLVRVLKHMPHVEGLIIASCASGNLGNLVLIVFPSICNEERSPFGERVESLDCRMHISQWRLVVSSYVSEIQSTLLKGVDSEHVQITPRSNRDAGAIVEELMAPPTLAANILVNEKRQQTRNTI